MPSVYRYAFPAEVSMPDVEASLVIALLAVECLHGESQARLDASHYLSFEDRVCVIDASSAVGRDVNKLFVGFLRREFGEDSFQVERLSEPPARLTAAAA